MSDDFATEVLTKSRKGILRVRTNREESIEEMRKRIAELEAEVAHDNDLLRQLDDAIQARAALTPAPDAGEVEVDEEAELVLAFDQGRNAYHEGCPINPYALETPNAERWHDGFVSEAEKCRAEAASRAEPADTITIASSSQHAEESAAAQSLPPLFKPEPPQAATPEQLEAVGVIDPEASFWARKLAKEPA